jgi:hypothetical protein
MPRSAKNDQLAEVLAALGKMSDKIDALSEKLNDGLGAQGIAVAKLETRVEAIEASAKAQKAWVGKVAAAVMTAFLLAAAAVVGFK